MSEPIKFTDEEIKSLVDLRDSYQQTITNFGQLYIERMTITERASQLNEAEQNLQKVYLELQKKEDVLLKSITAKYGVGSLDITNGTFTPSVEK